MLQNSTFGVTLEAFFSKLERPGARYEEYEALWDNMPGGVVLYMGGGGDGAGQPLQGGVFQPQGGGGGDKPAVRRHDGGQGDAHPQQPETRSSIYRNIYYAKGFCSRQSLARELGLSLPTVYLASFST